MSNDLDQISLMSRWIGFISESFLQQSLSDRTNYAKWVDVVGRVLYSRNDNSALNSFMVNIGATRTAEISRKTFIKCAAVVADNPRFPMRAQFIGLKIFDAACRYYFTPQ